MAPIFTCNVADNPPNTDTRVAVGDQAGQEIFGWLIRKPEWPINLWHLCGCHRGIAHIIGYISDPTQVMPLVERFRTLAAAEEKRRTKAPAEEWMEDGV